MKMDKAAQKAMAQKLQEASRDKINRNIKRRNCIREI